MEIEQTSAIFEKNYPDFFQKIQPLNLSNEEINSLYQCIQDYQNNIFSIIDENDKIIQYRIDNTEESFVLFLAWLLKDNLQTIPFKCPDKITMSSTHFFLEGIIKKPKNIPIYNIKTYPRFEISNPVFFNGKGGKFASQKLSNLFIYYSPYGLIDEKDNDKWLPKIKKAAQSLYKIHLMPTAESMYVTIYKLCKIMKTNPTIMNNIKLRDLINDFKVKKNPYNDPKIIIPIVVIYIPTIFISDKELKNLNIEKLSEHFEHYVDYTKSKQCLELLLTFLIQFFDKNTDCIGSGVIPRFNAKVTDMIFFAQGHGDDKTKGYLKKYFEDDLIYFKTEQGENFKVDIDALLKKALHTQSNKEATIITDFGLNHPQISDDSPTNQLASNPVPPSNDNQIVIPKGNPEGPLPIQSDSKPTTTQNNGNVGGIDFFYGIKQFFHSLLQSILSYFGFYK